MRRPEIVQEEMSHLKNLCEDHRKVKSLPWKEGRMKMDAEMEK
jgi:hypothetical protein